MLVSGVSLFTCIGVFCMSLSIHTGLFPFSFLSTYPGVSQCVAVCRSVLQCVAVCCSAVQCGAVCCSVLQCDAACCSALQCVAVC